MISDKSIRDIELGPRQLSLFDVEDRTSVEQERLMACVRGYIERHGQAEMTDFLQMAANALGWSEFQILQHLFYLAHELAIHFRTNERNIAPHAAKKVLIESSQPGLQIVLNQPVDETTLYGVTEFIKQICTDIIADDCSDQAELAHRLARRMVTWKNALKWCRRFAQRPGFAGAPDIETSLKILASISAKLDSFSLLHAFLRNKADITFIIKTIEDQTRFYSRHGETWEMLVQFAENSKKTLPESLEDPEVASAYERFSQILASTHPYDRVDEACHLLKTLKPRHQQIAAQQLRQYRATALTRVESSIRKIKRHLQEHAASDDMCNRSLFPLRTLFKNIKAARTIPAIDRYLQAAQEAFEAAWEQVADH